MVDLPGVGKDLVCSTSFSNSLMKQDHLLVPIMYKIPQRDSIYRLSNLFSLLKALLQFILFGSGILVLFTADVLCVLHMSLLSPQPTKKFRGLPNLEIFWSGAYTSWQSPEWLKGSGAGSGSILVQATTPKSVGTVRLSPDGIDDINVDPLVDPGFLTSPLDWDLYRRGLVFALEVGKEMAKSGYPMEEITVPKSLATDHLDRYIQEYGLPGQHVVASCRKKPFEEGGVVDQELRVYGVKGLRIADASVFPRIPSSKPHALVLLVAERCADFIRTDWAKEGLH